jgi:inhibitor of cysteine peptidase
MKRNLTRILWLALAWGLAGCAGPSTTVAPKPAPRIGDDHPMHVRLDAEFVVTLEANWTTGYRWQVARPLDGRIVKFVSNRYFTITQPGLVGAPGREVWTFRAVGRGATSIAFQYVRPWEKDVAPVRTLTCGVVVR